MRGSEAQYIEWLHFAMNFTVQENAAPEAKETFSGHKACRQSGGHTLNVRGVWIQHICMLFIVFKDIR